MASSEHSTGLRERLRALPRGARRDLSLEYELHDLFDVVDASSIEALAIALGELVAEGEVTLVFRIKSPLGGSLGDFDEPAAIPPLVEDRFDDWREIEVTPERVVPVYKFR